MATAIIQFDNRPQSVLRGLVNLILRNEEYCSTRGYDHHYLTQVDVDLPPFWIKPFLVAYYLEQGYDTVLWLDTDAVVHDFGRGIDELFTGDECFVFSPDHPLWIAPFNAGVFACKTHALPILREWGALFPAHEWTKNERGEWKCRHEEWAGIAFEQGAFSTFLLPKYENTGLLKALPWQTLQSPFPVLGSFTLHFAATFKTNAYFYLKDMRARRAAGLLETAKLADVRIKSI